MSEQFSLLSSSTNTPDTHRDLYVPGEKGNLDLTEAVLKP